MSFHAKTIRNDFPILRQSSQDRPLIYLDSAATTQKPQQVIDALVRYYTQHNANVGRGVYSLSLVADGVYERARMTMQRFVNAKHPGEIVFTRSTTDAVNIVARSYAEETLREGDEILVSAMEHHGNLCPWQVACARTGARIRVAPLDARGDLDLDAFRSLLTERTKLVAITHVSNVLGTVNPLRAIIAEAHRHGIPVFADGAQAVAHMPIDVQDLDCDFYCFSGHKMYGPMGIGVLYAKEAILDRMPPYQTGGGMAFNVTFQEITQWKSAPHKFEAGTPNVEGAVGLEAAAKYLTGLGLERIGAHEAEILRYATDRLREIESLSIHGDARIKAPLISFLVGDIHPLDIGNYLDEFGVAVRTGDHCTMPLVDLLALPVGTVRASFGVYTTKSDIDVLCRAVAAAKAACSTPHAAPARGEPLAPLVATGTSGGKS